MPIHIRKVKRDLVICKSSIVKSIPISRNDIRSERVLSFLSTLKRAPICEKKEKGGGTEAGSGKKASNGNTCRDYRKTDGPNNQPLEVHISKLMPPTALIEPQTTTPLARDLADLSWLNEFRVATIFGEAGTLDLDEQEEPIKCTIKPSSASLPNAKRGNSGPRKPGLTYTELIERALKENGELTVSGIYKWIYSNFPYFDKNDGRWKNSVRHNLSINPQFRKGNKCRGGGSGHFWTLNKEHDEEFKKWQEWKQTIDQGPKEREDSNNDDEEIIAATRSILGETDTTTESSADPGQSLLRVATDFLNGIERGVEVELMERSNLQLDMDESCIGSPDFIFSEPGLFSDALDLGFHPYEFMLPKV